MGVHAWKQAKQVTPRLSCHSNQCLSFENRIMTIYFPSVSSLFSFRNVYVMSPDKERQH